MVSEQAEKKCCFSLEGSKGLLRSHAGCQFTDETKFLDYTGKQYCRYHFPGNSSHKYDAAHGMPNEEEYEEFVYGIHKELRNAMSQSRLADLSGVVFPRHFNFFKFAVELIDDETFEQSGRYAFPGLIAVEARFPFGSVWGPLTFQGDVDFTKAQFGRRTTFTHAEFMGEADFRDCIFDEEVVFSFVKFWFDVSFEESKLGKYNDFSSAHFAKSARFSNCSFGASVDFKEAYFGGGCDFSQNTDTDKTKKMNFDSVQFCKDVDEPGDSRHPYQVSFVNRQFVEPTGFKYAKFHSVPIFYGAKLHEGCTICKAEFEDTQQDDCPYAYQVLKLAMEQKRDWNAMAKFYALEQRSLRHQSDTPWTVKFMSWAYEIASEYGQSIGRPLICLLGVAGLWFFLYAIILGAAGKSGGWDFHGEILRFDVLQMVRPFQALVFEKFDQGALSGLGGLAKGLIMGLAALQTIATAGFVTLFVLAVRRRFRMA